MKTCNSCKEEKPLQEFSKRTASPDGLNTQCRVCCAERGKKWNEENKERHSAVGKKWYEENKERRGKVAKLWRDNNAGRGAANRKAYREANPHVAAACCAKYRASKLNRTPPWANLRKIASWYKAAQQQDLTVDHIIPLQGKLVSGLHVHTNMQLLTPFDNGSKGNRHEIS